MNVRYRVELSQVERTELKALLSGGKHASRKLKRAQILLAADAGAGDEEIARSVGVGGSTVFRTKRRFVEGNLERALSEEPRPGAEHKLTGCWWRPPVPPPQRAIPAGRSSCWQVGNGQRNAARSRIKWMFTTEKARSKMGRAYPRHF